MRVTIYTEVEPPEQRPCPPLPLEGPILLKMVPDVFHKQDQSSAVPTSFDLGNTAFSADPLEADSKATEPTTSTRLVQAHFLLGFSLLPVLPFTRPGRFKWLFFNFLVVFLALVSVSYLLSASSEL
ncbi:hypothetical protein C8J57DRAFT_1716602 [Mycena rebaudengoi]|nr:hypothetical protein C8J57DRAFT_1716602 [Mycena rebaudengoi]